MRKLLILLLLPIVAFLSMGSASLDVVADRAASAAVVQTSVVHTDMTDDCYYSGCQTTNPDSRDARYAQSLYLPVNRWTDMNYHARLNWWNPVEASNAATSRLSAGVMMNAGNETWKLASDWSRGAMDFNPFESALGYQIDKVSGVLGNAITGQPVLFALIIAFLLVILLWRAMKRPGTRPIGKLFQAAVVFGLITMMGTQAAAGTTGPPTGTYTPRAGSPVWMANAVTGTIDQMASTAVSAVMNGMLPVLTSAIGAGTTQGWSCTSLIEGSFNAAKAERPTAGAEAVGRAMNSMWIATAYNTYSTVQFGDSNAFGKEVACRQLERITSADSYTRARMLSQSLYGNTTTVSLANPAATTPFASMTVPMLQETTDTEANDAAMVAWAACRPADNRGSSFVVRYGFSETSGGWVKAQDCAEAFAATTADEMKAAGGGAFNLADINAAREKTSNESVLNFINTLQGKDPGTALGSITSSVIFLIGAFIAAGIFGLMSLAVFASKIFMLLLVAGMFIILIISLFKNEPMAATMQQPGYRFLGVTIFAFGSTLLLALLATVSLIIASLSTLFGAAGTIGAMAWVSFSPILAIIGVHFLFTKVFKMPSPVTAKGALAWGTAGGAVGGAVGASMVNRMQNRGAAMAKGAGRAALGKSKYTSWMVGGGGADANRRGSGDAGTRQPDAKLGGDMTSEAIRQREGSGDAGPAAKRENPADLLGASERAVADATKYMTEDKKAALVKEAQRELRDEQRAARAGTPSGFKKGIADLQSKLEARNDARASLLAESIAGTDTDDTALLSEAARGKVSLVNRASADELDGFLLAPGAAATTIGVMPTAKWKDLSPEGKAEAQKLAAAAARTARARKGVDSARQAKANELDRERRSRERAAAKAELPPLSDRAKESAKSAAQAVSSLATPEGARNAAQATVSAARAASTATTAGAAKARQVSKDALAATRSDKGRKIATGAAVAAGAGLLALGNPVVGAVVIGAAAKKTYGRSKDARVQSKQEQQVRLNEIVAAKANARKLPTPRTSTVSEAAPVAPRIRD